MTAQLKSWAQTLGGEVSGCNSVSAPGPRVRVVGFKPFERNTLRGFFDLELGAFGIILKGCTLHQRDGKSWIGFLGRPYRKEDGSECWANIVDFIDNKSKYLLQDEALPKVLAAFAEAGR